MLVKKQVVKNEEKEEKNKIKNSIKLNKPYLAD
jgi:hypothetical protein